MKTHQAEVINCVQAKTKYGPRLVLNCKLLSDKSKVALWSNDLDNEAFKSKSFGQKVELIENSKGQYSILEREEVRNQNGNGLQHISEPLERIVDELNLPRLSPSQKRELANYIQQQANMFKHITDTVSSTMPDLKPNDHRAIAMSIFIDCQRRING